MFPELGNQLLGAGTALPLDTHPGVLWIWFAVQLKEALASSLSENILDLDQSLTGKVAE